MSPTRPRTDELLLTLSRILGEQGVHAVLKVLNGRTPHRYTGIYRYDSPTMRNVHLVDAFNPEVLRGPDVAMGDAYCVMVGDQRRSIVFNDATCDPRFVYKANSPVVSYCGVLLSTAERVPFGTLCHYDVSRCEENVNDVPLLQAIAPAIMSKIAAKKPDLLAPSSLAAD